VFALKGKPQDVRAIGALLGASWVLEGTVRRAGERLRVTAQLTSTSDGGLLWSQRFDRTFQDVFAIQEEIAQTIVDTLRLTSFAGLSSPAPARAPKSMKAYGLYLRGRYNWNKRTQESIAEAIRDFEQATIEDPGYALPYTGLADAYALGLAPSPSTTRSLRVMHPSAGRSSSTTGTTTPPVVNFAVRSSSILDTRRRISGTRSSWPRGGTSPKRSSRPTPPSSSIRPRSRSAARPAGRITTLDASPSRATTCSARSP
jgi:hypothetical protein